MIPKELANPEKITFTTTRTILKNLLVDYATQLNVVRESEEDGDCDLEDYSYAIGYTNAVKRWLNSALGISPESDFVQNIINKERK